MKPIEFNDPDLDDSDAFTRMFLCAEYWMKKAKKGATDMDRKLQESIDKRSSAVMTLERKYRAAVEALKAIEKFAEANNLQPHDGFDKIRDMAREALRTK